MSKIENGGLDQYGAEPFEQQQFGTAGVEGVNTYLPNNKTSRDLNHAHLGGQFVITGILRAGGKTPRTARSADAGLTVVFGGLQLSVTGTGQCISTLPIRA